MKKVIAIMLAAYACVTAFAQERTFLTKAEVENLANGKKWTYVRASDSNKIVWDLRSGGDLFANNRTAGVADAGTWSVNDQGRLCTKWRGQSRDGCVALFKDADKLKWVGAGNLKAPGIELEVE
jgi:aminoglycoside phosphotransferase